MAVAARTVAAAHQAHTAAAAAHQARTAAAPAVVVHTQDGLIDNIEQAVEQTVEDTKAAGSELTKAEGYQKKSRKVILCIFPILLIVLGAVIVKIVFFSGDKKP